MLNKFLKRFKKEEPNESNEHLVMLYRLQKPSPEGQQHEPHWMAYGESEEYGPAWNVTTPTFISKQRAKAIILEEIDDDDCLGFKMIPERRKSEAR